MPFVVKLARDVDYELLEISDFIALDNPLRADTFVRELVENFKNVLSQFPESGRLIKGEIRQLSYKKYTAFYTFKKESGTVFILHIVSLEKPLKTRGIEF